MSKRNLIQEIEEVQRRTPATSKGIKERQKELLQLLKRLPANTPVFDTEEKNSWQSI